MSKALELLAQWRQDAASIDAEASLAAFGDEVSRGIAGEPAGLPMIRSLELPRAGLHRRSGRTVVVDIGGTTLKAAVATVSEAGELSLSDVKTGPVPGLSGPVTEEAFFKSICRFAGIDRTTENLAVSFSHNMRVFPGFDGEITGWCKEITVTDPGVFTIAGLFRRIAGNPELKVRVTNDSVASMLGAVGDFRPGDTVLGLVNGTGFNICWVAPSGTIYNTEAGDSRAFEPGLADRLVDLKSDLPGTALCEKKTSGVYLAKIISTCLDEARKRKLPVDPASVGLDLRAYTALTDDYSSVFTGEALERSAKIAAICCEALIRRSTSFAPSGDAAARPRVIIATEGSVINAAENYKMRFVRWLKALDGGAHEIELVSADLAGLRGAARLMDL